MNKYFLRLLAGVLLLIAHPTVAEVYGIVIGIDAYKNFNGLEGAVNDAQMVADALTTIGANPIVLLDDKATRNNITQAWDDISAKAKAGDTVYFTYAGHGAQQPERVKGTEADGQDEFYVLANFATSGANTAERLMDDDLQEWFSKRPDLNIILVSDSCHSGTMTRAYKKTKLKYRWIDMSALTDDALPIPNNPDIVNEQKTKMPHVSSFSGVSDAEEVPEITIENKPHGALSWHFAQGLSGFADTNQDGVVAVSELKDYLLEKVRMTTEGQQHPQIFFVTDMALAKKNNTPSPIRPSVVALADSLPAIPFSVSQNAVDEALATAVIEKLVGIQLAKPEQAVLEWDIEAGVIRNQFDDSVYNVPVVENKTKGYQRQQPGEPGLSPETIGHIQAVIDKFRLIGQLKALSDGGLSIKLLPNDKLHVKGETVTFEVGRLKYPYFTLINLAVDGTVNFLYPILEGDTLSIPVDKPYQLALTVSEPFGADHFVAITSSKPLSSLHEMLKKLNNSPSSPDDLRKALDAALKDMPYQIGIHASFTTNPL